ncbi:hypothetical protein [Streptomyces sp. NPDC048442]|uniref:hypothetical protein n=1 Tax=Streptomyces sp. NPDC048442 TaxID=3154823 RepID=UPI00342A8986
MSARSCGDASFGAAAGAPPSASSESNPKACANFPQAAPIPSLWNVATMSSTPACRAAASGSSPSSGGSCATSVRTRPG